MKKQKLLVVIIGIIVVLVVARFVYASLIIVQPQELELLSQVGGVEGQPLADVREVVAVENYVYALDDTSLVILDASNPHSPRILSTLALPAQGRHLFVKEDRAYLSIDSTRDLYIIDVSHPDAPVQIKIVHLSGSDYETITDIFALGDRLYALSSGRLYALDLEGEEMPVELFAPGGDALFVQDVGAHRYAYLMNHDWSYHSGKSIHIILDIANEMFPTKVGEFSTYHSSGEIIIREDSAYLSEGYVFDVSDPANPVQITTFDGEWNIAMEGLHLYLSSSTILDVSDPFFFPIVAVSPLEEHESYDIAVSNGISYVAGGEKGLFVYRYLPASVFAQRWEAEDGNITSPMSVQQDAAACGGAYVVSQQAWNYGSIAFQFDAPVNDNYFIWARSLGPDWSRNSFWVSIDDGEPFQYEIRPPDGQWHWAQVYPEHQPVQPFGLTAGPHTLRFIVREADSSLDAIYITNHPGLHPTDANPCATPATPTPTPSPTATPLRPTTTPTPTPLPTPIAHGLEKIGQFGEHPFGGHAQMATAQGALAFVAHDDRLAVIDARNPYQFRTLGQSEPLPGRITSLGVKDYYVFAQANGLVVMDVIDPAHPRQVAYLPAISGDVHITGDRLYLVDGQTWVVFDISRPSSPQKIGQVTLPYHYRDIDFEGTRAYTVKDQRLFIFDLSDPATPMLEGVFSVPEPTWIGEVIARAPFVYIVTTTPYRDPYSADVSVVVVDISDVTHPVERGSYVEAGNKNDGVSFSGLVLHGSDLYFGFEWVDGYTDQSTTSLEKLDVSNPDDLRSVISVSTDDFAVPFKVSGSRLYANPDDLHVFRLSDLKRLPLDPSTNEWEGRPFGKSVGGSGQNAYLWDGEGIRILDNAFPTSPEQIDKYTADSYFVGTSASFEDDRVYAGYFISMSGEQMVCVANLALPVDDLCRYIIPTGQQHGWMYSLISASHGYAFLDTWDYEKHTSEIVDTRDLENMTSVARTDMLPVDATILDCCPENPYAVWAMNPEEGQSYILITPANQPETHTARLEIGPPIRKIKAAGDVLAVLTDNELRLVDVSAPGNPRETGRYAFAQVQGQAQALQLVGHLAYAGIGNQLRVVDFSDLAHPVEVGVYNAPDDVLGVHVQGHTISLAVNEAGMINLYATDIFFPQILH